MTASTTMMKAIATSSAHPQEGAGELGSRLGTSASEDQDRWILDESGFLRERLTRRAKHGASGSSSSWTRVRAGQGRSEPDLPERRRTP